MNIDDFGKPYVQTRIMQPLGLIEVIDRNPQALEDHPDTRFRLEHGRFVRDPRGEHHGGAYSLFTRVWMGVVPPTGAEPGYVGVVGEVYETNLPLRQRTQARWRPLFLLDEASELIVPKLMNRIARMKDIYMPYVDRADLMENPRRHDPDMRLYLPEDEEFLGDLRKSHYGITAYPDEEDLSTTECKVRWPEFRSRGHVVPALFPPYKENPERLYALIDAMMMERNEANVPMFSHHRCCKVWAQEALQGPHLAVAMVASAMQHYDWAERLDPDTIDEVAYPWPTDEEERQQMMEEDETADMREVMHYIAGDRHARSAIASEGFDQYARDFLGTDRYGRPLE